MLILALASNALAQTDYEGVTRLLDSAKGAEAAVFAPKSFSSAQNKLDEAKKAIDSKKGQQTIDKLVAEARQLADDAIKVTEECKATLKEYMRARDRARQANAPSAVPDIYAKAEEQFLKATRKVESGDVKGALNEAAKSTPLFDTAESEAIKTGVLAPAKVQLDKAVALESEKFAPVTLGRAQAAYQKAIDNIAKDRSNVAGARQEGILAEYEAKHASNIAQTVKSLDRNDQAYEILISTYEVQMNRVGQAMGIESVRFHNGPPSAADSLISNYNRRVQTISDSLSRLNSFVGALASQLQVPSAADPSKMLGAVQDAVAELIAQNKQLTQTAAQAQTKLAELSQTHEEAEAKLTAYQVADETLEKARAVLNPTEGALVENSAGDLVVRVKGLQFPTGKWAISEDMVPLLEKVQSILLMFPNNKLMVQGHTDDQGGAETNMTLSNKRAIAVMDYFRQAMALSAERISAKGFGADKPITTNQTPEGRAQNRRIDIVILR
jgi:outer membrane protein OmpA-like peptidoglycan-associated protein